MVGRARASIQVSGTRVTVLERYFKDVIAWKLVQIRLITLYPSRILLPEKRFFIAFDYREMYLNKNSSRFVLSSNRIFEKKTFLNLYFQIYYPVLLSHFVLSFDAQ